MEGEEAEEVVEEGVGEVERMDRSFHSVRAGRLNISELDPSLSLCFLCHTEQDFDNLCIGEYNVDPPDPHVFGPPGSGSESGSFYHHA